MADYYPQDRRVHNEVIAGLALRRTPMVREKQSYAVDQMRDVLLGCPELKGVTIPPVEHRPEELEKFFGELLAERRNLDFFLASDILILFP